MSEHDKSQQNDESRNDPSSSEVSQEEQAVNKTTDAKVKMPGSTASSTTSHASKKRRKTMLMLTTCTLVFVGMAWYFGSGSRPDAELTNNQKKVAPKGYISQHSDDETASTTVYNDANKITLSLKKLDFGTIQTDSGRHQIALNLSVQEGSYRIDNASIPYGTDDGFGVDDSDCTRRKSIKKGESCLINVTFTPNSAVSASGLNLTIIGAMYGSQSGKYTHYEEHIPVIGNAIAPPQTPSEKHDEENDGKDSNPTAANPFDAQNQQEKEDAARKEQEEIHQKAVEEQHHQAVVTAQQQYLSQANQPTLNAQATQMASINKEMQPDTPEPPYHLADALRPMEVEPPSGVVMSSYPFDQSRFISMGTAIPAVIENTIDSRFPTIAKARVERDIYGEDGRIVIIEKGSEVLGSASGISSNNSGSSSSGSGSGSDNSVAGISTSSVSNEKVSISWNRIRRPDGVIFEISGSSADAMGRGGITSLNDDRPLERFGAGLIATILETVGVASINGSETQTNTGGTSMLGGSSTGGTTSTTLDGRAMASQTLQSGLQPLVQQMEQEQLSLPIIRLVPAGTAFNIILSKDIMLKRPRTPYEARAALSNGLNGSQASPDSGNQSGQQPPAQPVAPPPPAQQLAPTAIPMPTQPMISGSQPISPYTPASAYTSPTTAPTNNQLNNILGTNSPNPTANDPRNTSNLY